MSAPVTSLKVGRGKFSYLVGMQWDYAATKKDAKVKSKALKKTRRSQVLVLQNADKSWLVGFSEYKVQANFVAAPIFASMIGTGIVRHILDDGRVWLFACVNGAVIPFHDVIVSAGDDDVLVSWISEIQSDNIVEFQNEDWTRVDEFCDALPAAKKKPWYIKRPVNKKQLALVNAAGIAIAVLGLSGYFFMDYQKQNAELQNNLSPEERKAAFERLMAAKADLERLVREKKERFNTTNASADIKSLLEVLDEAPSPYPYASLAKIHCKLSEQDPDWSCIPTWQVTPELGLLAKAHISPGANPKEIVASSQLLAGEPIRISATAEHHDVTKGNTFVNYAGPWELWLRDDFYANVGEEGVEIDWADPKPVQHFDPELPEIEPVAIGMATQLIVRLSISSLKLRKFLEWLERYPSHLQELSIDGEILSFVVNIHSSSQY